VREVVQGRLVLAEDVVPGRLVVEDGWITDLVTDPGNAAWAAGPLLAPGLIDVHVHGWGGHDGTGDAEALSGMARALLRQGITSFLPTAPSLPEREIPRFAARVREWMPSAPADGAEPLGFNLEGPFIAPARKGAHDPALLRTPENIDPAVVDGSLDGLRIMTIAPELAGALALIERLAGLGIVPSIGHSAATLDEARAGYRAAGTGTPTTTTHLFNAMTGVDHRLPGLAVAALTDDDAYVELIADGFHVHPALWPIILRSKPAGRLILISDAMSLAGCGDGPGQIGGLDVVVHDGRVTLTGTDTLAGSVIAINMAVRNLVREGVPLPVAVAAASSSPAALLGETDRGRIEVGRRAHLLELDDDLRVRRVTRGAGWFDGATEA
jgi:N-acetylglucosamine-6-phosphate deacetylase